MQATDDDGAVLTEGSETSEMLGTALGKSAMRQVLELLKVTTIVCVDDNYEDTQAIRVEEVIARVREIRITGEESIVRRVAEIFPEIDLSAQANNELWPVQMRDWWESGGTQSREGRH